MSENPFGGTYRPRRAAESFGRRSPEISRDVVRKLLQVLHPDKYRGDNPGLAAELFLFFVRYSKTLDELDKT